MCVFHSGLLCNYECSNTILLDEFFFIIEVFWEGTIFHHICKGSKIFFSVFANISEITIGLSISLIEWEKCVIVSEPIEWFEVFYNLEVNQSCFFKCTLENLDWRESSIVSLSSSRAGILPECIEVFFQKCIDTYFSAWFQ